MWVRIELGHKIDIKCTNLYAMGKNATLDVTTLGIWRRYKTIYNTGIQQWKKHKMR